MQRSFPFRVMIVLGVLALVIGACGNSGSDTTIAPTTVAAPTTTTTTEATTTTDATTTTTLPEIDDAGLGGSGPYGVGSTQFDAVDTLRDGRLVSVLVYYPAITDSDQPEPDADPDATGAPYPVIVGDGQIGEVAGPHLASHGFVFAAVQFQHTWGGSFTTDMIDYPLDHMVALDALETLEDDPVAGLADTNQAGTIGYSFGGWDALMLTGARIDPDHYERTCASRPEGWSDNWWGYICGSESRWDRFVERADQVGIATSEGLWAPMGDERIRAAMPMGAEGYDMTGPDGLAEATAAVLLIGAGADTGNDYDPATTELFRHYPGADLITFVGAHHLMISEPDAVDQMRRFAVAFFGYRLAGRDDYARFLTEQFVEEEAPRLGPTDSFETLIWGVPED